MFKPSEIKQYQLYKIKCKLKKSNKISLANAKTVNSSFIITKFLNQVSKKLNTNLKFSKKNYFEINSKKNGNLILKNNVLIKKKLNTAAIKNILLINIMNLIKVISKGV